MRTLHYEHGYKRACAGGRRAMPSNIKILTQAYKDWYDGYDDATSAGKNAALTTSFNERKRSTNVTVLFWEES